MNRKRIKHKIETVLIIIILVCSGLLSTMLLNPELHTATAASTWTQTSDKDFNINGTFNNTTVIGSSENAELQIDLSELQTWTKATTTNKPIGRYGHAMASIYGTDKVLLFGGYSQPAGYKYLNDTWVYDLSENSWTHKSPLNNPSARSFHAMASVDGDDKVVIFGGSYTWNDQFSDTWVYDLSDDTWTEKATGPESRYTHAMTTIYGTNNVLLVGGSHWDGFNMIYFDDTWVYDLSGDIWLQMEKHPTAIYQHAMATINGTDNVLLYGGIKGMSGLTNDTWVFNVGENRWTKKDPPNNPGKIYDNRMAAICGSENILLFGGHGFSYNNDTWVYDLNKDNWTKKIPKNTPSNRPSVRHGQAMASVYGMDRVVMFGGVYWPGSDWYTRDDTWIYRDYSPTKNGTFVSAPYDTGSNSSFQTISWYASTPENTSIIFQLRTAANESGLSSKTYIGPNGTNSTFYNISSSIIWPGHSGDRWVQYKVYFNLKIFTNSPSLKDITIAYNCLPTTIVLNPVNDSLLTINKPTFKWTFVDYDSEHQKAFQVLIDDNISFDSITYDSGVQTTTVQYWQFPTGANYTELSDGTWYWKVRTMDADDTWTEYSYPRILNIDSCAPSSAITVPENNGFYNNLDVISGLATDNTNCSGLNKVEINIRRLSDNAYWDGIDWVPLPTWLLTSGHSEWAYDSINVTWSSGTHYHIQSRAIDHGTLVEVPGSGNTFTFDVDKPSSTLDILTENLWLNKLNTISGVTIDTGGSGVKEVKISIKSTRDNNFWDGTGWSSDEQWLSASGTDVWSYDSKEIEWSSGAQYTIHSQATDHAGNVESSGNGITISYDNSPPEQLSIYINDDEEFTHSTGVILSATAEDLGSGISQMSFSIDGTKWSNWESFSTTNSIDLLDSDGEKIVYVKVCDIAGNIAEPVFDTIVLDTTPPTDLSIKINDNAEFTNSNIVTITLSATDPLSGVGDMSITYDPLTKNWFPWEPFELSKTITIPDIFDDGEITIYYRVQDSVGNIAEPVFDTIILDMTAPRSLSISINDGALETNSTSVTLQLNGSDDNSGMSDASFSIDGESWSAWEPFNQRMFFTLPPNDGEKIIYFRARDRAGNIAETVSATIVLNTTQPVTDIEPPEKAKTPSGMEFWYILLSFIIIIFLLTIAGLIIAIRRKKRSIQQLLLPGTVTIKPGELLTPVISVEQFPGTPKVTELPGTVDTIDKPQPIVPTTSVPALVKSTQTSPEATAQETAQAKQLPQLPPAQMQTPTPKVSTPTTAPVLTSQPPQPALQIQKPKEPQKSNDKEPT